MPIRPLVDLATTACIKNIRELDSVGDYLPYENVKPILLKVDNAHQLRQIELNSPQIDGETGEIWLRLIERDFPLEYKAKAYKPQDPRKWYRVWEKYKRDHDRAKEESENQLLNALAGLRENREKNVSKIVERKDLPRSLQVGTTKRGVVRRDGTSTALRFGGGSRTKTMNGAGVMRRVRREVKEIANIHGSLSKAVRSATKTTALRSAPPAMVNDYRRAAQPAYKKASVPSEPSSLVKEYEDRATFLSDSEFDSEDRDGDDDDALFGDDADDEPLPKMKPRTPQKSRTSSAAAASLLKKRPSTAKTSTVRQIVGTSTAAASKAGDEKTPSSTSSRIPGKRSSGILSNSYKPRTATAQTALPPVRAMPKPHPKPAPKSLPLDEPTKGGQYLPRTQTSPPLAATSASLSPPPPQPQLPATGSEAQPRKRKAVDIFMRKKKRKV